MNDPLHNADPRAAALQIEHHPAGAWLVPLLRSPVEGSNKVRIRGRYVVQTWTALVVAVGGTGVCVGPADVVALAGLLTTRPRSSTGPFLRLDWLDGSGAPLAGSRSWSPPMTDAGPVDLVPTASESWGGSQELASDVIRAQADLQRAHAATIAAGVRELSNGHAGQVAELRKTIHELQSIVIAQSQDLRGLANAAMKHESRGAARAYELALDHVQRAHEVQIQAERADSGGVGLALAAELAPPVLALARDVVAVRQGKAPPSASASPSALQPARVQLDAPTLRAAVLRLLRDAAGGHGEARAMVRDVVASLDEAERGALAPLLLGM